MKEKLIELAKKQANEIIEEAKKKAEEIIKQAEIELERKLKKRKEEIRKEVEREVRKILAEEIIKLREDIIKAKEKKREEIINKILEELEKIDFDSFFNNFLEYCKKYGEIKDVKKEGKNLIAILDNGLTIEFKYENIRKELEEKVTI